LHLKFPRRSTSAVGNSLITPDVLAGCPVQLLGMAGRVRVREIGGDEGNRLRRIVHRGTGSVGRWRRAPMVPGPAQGSASVAQITGLAFTSEDGPGMRGATSPPAARAAA